MTALDIPSYRIVCQSLPGGEILDRYTDAEIAAICNGVGAAWTDKVLPKASSILNRALPWAIAPSIIHDLAYHEGIGGNKGREKADDNFLSGCFQQIELASDFPWTRWWRQRKARALHSILRKYGQMAWGGK